MERRARSVLLVAFVVCASLVAPAIARAGLSFDVSLTITNGVTEVTAGTTTVYTMTLSNEGPSTAAGSFSPQLPFPASSWTCSGSGTCSAGGTGNPNDPFELDAGESVTYLVSVPVPADATGVAIASDTVSLVGDNDEANDSASDEDTIEQEGDLSITKTDGVASLSPGEQTTYTVDVSNAGPSEVQGTVTDDLPAVLDGVSWTCATQAGGATCGSSAGTGDVSVSGSILPPGGSIRFVITGTVDSGASGTLVNTATVAITAPATDPDSADDSATDTDTLVPEADLSITKTDGVTAVKQGAAVTYVVTAANAGPADTTATVTDVLPDAIAEVSWTCVGSDGGACGAPDGSGDLSDTPTLPAGGEVIYTVSGTLPEDATGSLTNTATVAGADADPNETNNSATDVDAISELVSDLVLTKELVGDLEGGEDATYTLSVHNAGPDAALGPIVVTDDLPDGLDFVSAEGGGWDCSHEAGLVTCTHAGDLAAGATSTITLVAEVTAEPGTPIVNRAEVLGESVEADEADNDDSAGATVAAGQARGGGTLPITGSGVLDLLVLATGLVALGLAASGARAAVRRAHQADRHGTGQGGRRG